MEVTFHSASSQKQISRTGGSEMKRLHNWLTTVLLAGALLSAILGLLMPGATQPTFAAQVANPTVYSDTATFTTQAYDPNISQVVHIISDVTVKYSETLVPGWETVAFDDSTWLNVVAPSGGLCDPSVPSRIPDSEALPVWSQTPQQFQTIYARKTFIAALPTSATIQTMVDDDFDLYVNGVLVRSDWDGVASYFVDDISALVQNGVNVIAIKARDSFGGCQHLAFDVTVETAAANCVPPPDGLVSWWPGDGNALDIQSGNDGTLLNGAGFAPGMVGEAFLLDGVDDRVLIGNPANLQLQNFTLDLWVKPDILKHSELLVYGFGGYGTVIERGNNISLTKVGVSNVQAPPFPDTDWHHVAVTKDGNAVVIYLDGIAFPKPPYDPGFFFTSNLAIGNRDDAPLARRALDGLIDEVEIYNRALSASEIQAIFSAGSAGKCKVQTVMIDIKPGSDPNSINCNNENGVIAVAILTTEDFDATTVDHTTVTLEGASETHVDKKSGQPRRHEEDVDGDGDIDLVFHFRLGGTDLTCDSTEAALTGETFDGQAIEGTDAVRMIDRGGGKP